MKNVAIAGLLSASLLALSHGAFATEERYPGYNNEPKVLYQDWALIKSYGSAAVAQHSEKRAAVNDPKYPGAYFEPYVIYRSPDADKIGSKPR